MEEKLTDGKTGMDNAKRFIKGDYPKPKDGYDGLQNGTGSIVNKGYIPLKDRKVEAEVQDK